MTDSTSDDAHSAKVDACFDAVVATCAERGIEVVRLDSPQPGWLHVELTGTTCKWGVQVDCTEENLQLPSVRLRPVTSLLAHVSYSGTICIDDGQGLSLDADRPHAIVAHAVEKAYKLLEHSALDATTGRAEFFNELGGYWLWLPDSLRARAYFEVDGVSRMLKGYVNRTRKPHQWFFTEREAKVPWEVKNDKLESQRALYVHLDEIALPPVKPGKLTTAFIEDILQRLNPEQLALWEQLVGPSKNGPKQVVLLVSVPRQAGGRSLIGLTFGAHRGKVNAQTPVAPLTMRLHTAAYMRERGGASLELKGKHIAVLGAGAVGSVVVDTLAAAGIGRLTVVDHDEYSEDNVFRHVLDPLYIDLAKPYGLQLQLERRYPGLKIEPVAETAQRWLKSADLSRYDGVVLAFGAPSIERSFSRALKKKHQGLPIVFTWLEAADVGGHSVLMWSDGEGCLECLYRDDEGLLSLAPRTAFLTPNQPVTKNLTGCSGAFVPYGALQARRTGLMAAEQILSAMEAPEEARRPSYRFWVGDGKAAAAQGLLTTPWFQAARITTPEAATQQVFGRACKHCREPA